MQKLHRNYTKIMQKLCKNYIENLGFINNASLLVISLSWYFYLSVDFNYSLDSVKTELVYIVKTMPDILLV